MVVEEEAEVKVAAAMTLVVMLFVQLVKHQT